MMQPGLTINGMGHCFLYASKKGGNQFMTKEELIEKVSLATWTTKADAGRSVDAVFTIIKEALQDRDRVAIPGFGTFSVTRRKARTGRNPQTGEAIEIQAKDVPKFKAGKALRELL
jgi:DNA-binding protein HU-beta